MEYIEYMLYVFDVIGNFIYSVYTTSTSQFRMVAEQAHQQREEHRKEHHPGPVQDLLLGQRRQPFRGLRD
eukprot:3973477-Amphidinium_carterae.1